MKRIFTILFAAMLAGQAWAKVFFVDNLKYTITDAEKHEVSVDKASFVQNDDLEGILVIPAEVEYEGVKYSVTSIDYNAFYGCSGLTSVIIPNSVTSIGQYAFCKCTLLKSVTIPSSVTSIGSGTFGYSDKLTEINVESANTIYASENGVLFDKEKTHLICYPAGKTETYTIPSSVTTIGDSAFFYCENLTSVTIPNSVTSIGNRAFYYCRNMTTVTIGNSVTSIGDYAFYDCDGLTSVTIPNSVTSISEGLFAYCSGLTTVTIGNSVKSIGNRAFDFCFRMTSFTIPNSVTYIGDRAFSDCSGLKTVVIPDSVTYIGNGAFCSGDLRSLIIGKSVTTIGDDAFSDCNGLTTVTIPNSVTYIGNGAFYDCGLKSVVIPDSVTYIGNGAFKRCDLTSVTIGKSVTTIGDEAFSGCSKLTTIVIPDSVTYIGNGAFKCCDLTSVTIGKSVTTIGDEAFSGCCKLITIDIPESVTSIGAKTLCDCSGLTSVTIPYSVISIGDHALKGCTNSTIICEAESKPAGWHNNWNKNGGKVVWNVQFGEGDFEFSYNKSSDENTAKLVKYNGKADSVLIKGAVLIDNTYYKITHINDGVFSNCGNLKSVKLSSELIKIGESAFNNCTSLECIDIPISVKRIGKSAFQNCTKSTIYCEAESKPDGWDSDWNYNGGKVFWNMLRQIGKNDDFVFEYNSTQDGNTAILLKYNGCSEHVSVPNVIIDSIEYTVIYIDDEAFCGNEIIKTVKLPITLRGFGKNVFKNCTALESIVIPDSVYRISENMFYGCSSLKSVGLSQAVEFIMDGAFGESGLEFIALPKNVTYIGDFAFVDCENLKLVYIPETVVKNEANAFNGCTNATIYCAVASQPETWSKLWNEDGGTVVWGHSVPKDSTFELKFVTKSDGTAAVASCPNEASSVNIPTMVMIDSSVYFVTGIESGVFSGCRNLNNINIEGNNPVLTFVDSVLIDKMNATLLACLTVKTGIYTIPDWVTSINSKAFMNCSNLQTVQIPKSVTQIGAYAFDGCDSLTIYCKTESKPSGWDDEWNPDNCNVIWGRFTPVIESAATAVNIYAYGNTIIVENATEEISVYNAMGMLVAHMGKGDVQPITINGTGVYIVKTGNAVKRVVVN